MITICIANEWIIIILLLLQNENLICLTILFKKNLYINIYNKK